MRCEVDKFERGKDLTIIDWINQMETYFIIGQVPPEAFTGCMQMKIAEKHLNEIQRYVHLDYLQFWENLVEIFEEPDMATTYMSALQSICQEREEDIPNFMQRVRSYALKAHPKQEHNQHERIIVNSFLLGLQDRQLAPSFAAGKPERASDAMKRCPKSKQDERTIATEVSH